MTKRTFCLSKVRRQALGLLLYTEDGDGRFPARKVWMDSTARYLKGYRPSNAIFRCPVVPEGAFGYAFNAALSRAKSPPHPETVPLTYDSVTLIRNASDRLASLPSPGRHQGRNTVGYADGHGKSVAVQ